MEEAPEPPARQDEPVTKRRWFTSEPPWWVRDFLVAGLVGLVLVGVQIVRDDQREANDQRLSNLSFVRDKAAGPSTARNFQNIDLEGMNISGLELPSSKFEKANLREINALRSSLELSNFYGAQLSDANLAVTRLQAVDLSGVDASRADFSYAHLEYGRFESTKLEGARFDFATLDNADLSHVDMSRVSGLETASLTNICYDEGTKWPKDFQPPPSRTGTERLDYCGPRNSPLAKQGESKTP